MKLRRRRLLSTPKMIMCLAGVLLTSDLLADGPVALRVESFTVPPSTQPLLHVTVKNLADTPYQGTIAIKPPPQWQIAPPAREVSLAAGETGRVPFTIEKGTQSQSKAPVSTSRSSYSSS